MYPNSQHVDEPTMTDLRGILPGQRPPVDARVLDEPTSEVPIIKPAGVDTDPEPEPVVTDAEPAQEAEYVESAEALVEETEDTEPAAEADTAAVAETAEAVIETEPEVEAEPETFEAETFEPETFEAEAFEPETFEAEAFEPEAEAVAPPEPAFTPPVMPSFGAGTSVTAPGSEMGKMAWSPAPPPGLIPVAERSPFEPAPVAEISEPEVSEPEVSEPEAIEAETIEIEEPEAVVEAEPAAEITEVDEPAPAAASHAPGEVSEAPVSLWSDDAAQGLRDQWRDLQVQFIDDPNAAVNGAKGLVTEAVRELADTLLAAQAELDPFRAGDRVDTETMRVAMRRYREFLDRVLAL